MQFVDYTSLVTKLYISMSYDKCIVKAAHQVPDGEMFTLSVRRSFMRRQASFPVPIEYAYQFISFFQYIIIRVRQAKLWH